MTRGAGVVRVASYNIHALKNDRAALHRVVQAIAPDVLLLQEVPRHPLSSHRIAALAADFGLTWSGGSRGGTSTAVMTSLRVDEQAAWRASLPTPRFSEPRGYAVVQVALPGFQPLTAVGTHFGLPAADRAAQSAALVARLRRIRGPLVVGGDVNERAGGPVWHQLGAILRAVPGASNTFPAAVPDRQIDAFWSSPDLQVQAVDPATCGTPSDRVRASDHLPIVIDVHLPGLR
ncbi:endonuclease/exonuclease/phosphatase family metal-dependent hydrolase [Branchiibius hedensis]|uniref:Metal-dependent hydrolase, endonuclease/exonuclease/phosphatase family n=1 Tax=Branchiibius hedensis TaxID=672460 RepID=A0A2Y9BT93_9MICO|nr:endonuclease/exonuclease/phosphatase family protein [Branchiibius hedensis]PWJ24836.1 endonuclease/exonuclease/phosphatase family metal-dependent hydrolase [Branchiibius hedensis]SSA33652.1 Metal-dependent hydrolase, endonuclease/exonuclease/phosphatase family [Branchiibius hedensis]